MRAKGLSRKKVLAKLKTAHAKDFKYSEYGILCSMCTSPHPLAKKASEMFSESNLGDAGLFQGSRQLEKEAIKALCDLLHAPAGSDGFIVSGGTEANLMAIYAARNLANVQSPEVVIPESAHFSFDKICDLLRLKLVKVGLDKFFRMDLSAAEENINEHTVAVVANAGSAELGVVDPVRSLSQIALDHDVPLHVDAAFGGLILPFLKKLGYPAPDFDFELNGVQSLTVDPHKMGMSTIPAGGILFRSNKTLECIKREAPYLNEHYQYTFVGTRSAASAASAWAVFESLGIEGFKKTAEYCMDLTTYLYEGLEEAGFEVLLRPSMNIVAFRNANSKMLTGKLRRRGWFVSYVPRLDCARVVLMPHTTKKHVADFLRCLCDLR